MTDMMEDYIQAVLNRFPSCSGHFVDPRKWTPDTKDVIYGLLTTSYPNGPRLGEAMCAAIKALDSKRYEALESEVGYKQVWQVALLLDSLELLPKTMADFCKEVINSEPSMEQCLCVAKCYNPHPIIALLGTLTLIVHRGLNYMDQSLDERSARKLGRQPTFLKAVLHMGLGNKLKKSDKIVNFGKTLENYGFYIALYKDKGKIAVEKRKREKEDREAKRHKHEANAEERCGIVNPYAPSKPSSSRPKPSSSRPKFDYSQQSHFDD